MLHAEVANKDMDLALLQAESPRRSDHASGYA